jgi:predicted SprT family Zn-dependent metalloprotease
MENRDGLGSLGKTLQSLSIPVPETGLGVARLWAKEQMEHWGLLDWTFVWTDAQAQFGFCNSAERTIGISRKLTLLNTEDEFRDTVLHEIAHALAGHTAGHGARWIMACHRVGARPERTGTYVTPPAKWTGTCPNGCGYAIGRRTLFKEARRMACPTCCGRLNDGRWHPALVLNWTENT